MIIINKINLLNNHNKWIVFANNGVNWIYRMDGDEESDEIEERQNTFHSTNVSDIDYEDDLTILNIKYKGVITRNSRHDNGKRIVIRDSGDIFCNIIH